MTFAGLFRSALARRLAYVLVAAALAWCGMGRAQAQETCPFGGTCNKAQAYQACLASKEYSQSPAGGNWSPNLVLCVDDPTSSDGGITGSWRLVFTPIGGTSARYFYGSLCSSGETWDDETKTCNEPCDASGPSLSGGWVKGSTLPYGVCVNKCTYSSESLPGDFNITYKTVDGETYWLLSGWKPTGEACTVNDDTSTPPPPDADGDGVSDGNDPAPHNPGVSTPTSDNPPQGSSNNSGDGSGNGNQSYGGGSCGAPPSSSGDAILAQIAYQTWATRCAIENAKDSNGNLRTTETGTGNGSGTGGGQSQGNGECGQGTVNQAICASREFLSNLWGFFGGVEDEAANLDHSFGDLQDEQSIWAPSPDSVDLDSAGFGLSRACPAPPTYNGISLDPNGYLCMFAGIIGALVLAAAYAQAGYIIGRA